MTQFVEEYSQIAFRALVQLPSMALDHVIEWLKMTQSSGATIWLAGNGGSASTAEHFACDLQLHHYRATSLTSNGAALTAFSNDINYECALGSILHRLAHPGDTLIAISTSGNSPNILQAVRQAKQDRIYTIGMTGKPGGELAKMVDVNLVVQTDDTQVCEDMHLMMAHMIVRSL